jgi:predicted amidohydrolase YtcJ
MRRRAVPARSSGVPATARIDGIRLDDRTGTLEVGKLADLVVVDRDLLGDGAPRPTEATVQLTFVERAIVYDGR